MNSAIDKTFCKYSTESLSLSLRYKKISKKAVKIGGFLQCSVHIFLGHDGCFWKINLRISWSHMKNRVNVTASYSPKHFLLKALNHLLGLCLADIRILYFWQVLKSIFKFIIEVHALQCLFVRRSNKQQRRSRIISNFTKGQTFLCLMTTKCSWG